MTPLLRRISWLFSRKKKTADLDEEIRFHLEAEADEQEANGLSPANARRSARLDFGNVETSREDTRAAWGWMIWEQLAQDVRYAWRTMARNPAFTALAVLSLALGIGANTTIFSFADAVLLRSLPVADPDSLVRMTWHTPENEYHGSSYHDSDVRDPVAGFTGGTFSYPGFQLFQHGDVFSAVFAYQSTSAIAVTVHDEAEQADGEYVSGDYFRGLGVTQAAGRLIGPDDDRAGAALVAVLDFAQAVRRFGGARDAVGQRIFINNAPFTVIGVTPAGFFGTDPGVTPDLFVPMHADLVLAAGTSSRSPAARYLNRSETWLEVMARLKPGVTLARAQAELAPAFHVFSEAVKSDGRWKQVQDLRLVPGAGGIDGLRRQYSTPLVLLLALAGLILALACANIANLLLARTGARTREIAVRLTLGAGRARIIRQLMTESLVLSCVGGVLGVGVAIWGQRVVTRLLSGGQENFTLHAALDVPVLLVALALSLLTGILFGWLPARRATRFVSAPATVDDLRSRTPSAGRPGSRRVLLVAQIAVTLVMLVAAGLFARTLSNLQSIDPGFNRDRLLTFTVDARQAGLEHEQAQAFYRDLQARLRAVPGVLAATMSDNAVIGDGRSATMAQTPAMSELLATQTLQVGGDFHSTMQIPMVRGRGLEDRDNTPGAPPAVVVSEAFVKAGFRDRDALGQYVRLPTDSPKLKTVPFEIVGVARDVTIADLQYKVEPTLYMPASFELDGVAGQMVYELRTTGDPITYGLTVREVVHDTNPRVPVARIQTQRGLIDQTISRQITLARLCSWFAILALAIAIVGLYGTVLYDVTRRTAEIGIRMALGATGGRVLWMVLRDVLLVAAAGLAIGIPAAVALARVADTLLVGVTRHDPFTMIAAAAILTAAMILAGFMPARHAARLNPTTALHRE